MVAVSVNVSDVPVFSALDVPSDVSDSSLVSVDNVSVGVWSLSLVASKDVPVSVDSTWDDVVVSTVDSVSPVVSSEESVK